MKIWQFKLVSINWICRRFVHHDFWTRFNLNSTWKGQCHGQDWMDATSLRRVILCQRWQGRRHLGTSLEFSTRQGGCAKRRHEHALTFLCSEIRESEVRFQVEKRNWIVQVESWRDWRESVAVQSDRNWLRKLHWLSMLETRTEKRKINFQVEIEIKLKFEIFVEKSNSIQKTYHSSQFPNSNLVTQTRNSQVESSVKTSSWIQVENSIKMWRVWQASSQSHLQCKSQIDHGQAPLEQQCES